MKWLDFEFEDEFGFFLADLESCRTEQSGVLSNQEDTKIDTIVHYNQETGHGLLPARMVGLSSSDWVENISMEAELNDLTILRLKGED